MTPNQEKKLLSKKSMEIIFSNIEQIRYINKDVLEALDRELSNWTPRTTIGNIILDMVRKRSLDVVGAI